MIIREPKWKSWVVETTIPLFNSHQCQLIINAGLSEPIINANVGVQKDGPGEYDTKKRLSRVSWIPFKKMPQMYSQIEEKISEINNNYFGFEGVKITEMAQFTEYGVGGFYDWHTDCNISGENFPPVRKISMTCLLSNETEFEGGGLELIEDGKICKPKQGQAVFFASFIRHRVVPVTKGIRRSLVMWFGGPSFK
jgi:PKHD-type hydroxylase